VVRDADPGQIQVSFVDDPTPYRAELLSYREHEDLALLHITGPMQPFAPIANQTASQSGNLTRDGVKEGPRTKFPTVRMGTSADLMPGETVVAIGNPHGQTHTVSQGIISGLHRNIDVGGRFGLSFSNLIQTDASINLGNSGGPLLNVHGEMIGINSVMNTAAENIGYAIPVDRVREVLTQQLFPSAQSAWTGLEFEDSPEGRVSQVWPGSPAALAGICQGDKVLKIAGKDVIDEATRLNASLHVAPYRNTEFLIENSQGERISKQLTPWDRFNGVLFAELGCTFTEVEAQGGNMVLVDRLRSEGPAEELGLQKGDWIRDVKFLLDRNDERVLHIQGTDDLYRLVSALPSGASIEIELYRDLNKDSVFTRDERHRGRLTLP
ncbi:MAG TPA: trypsin-like peptidase domain-containing protein, partial [Planctomycetota bacterium]|nr:trypsin-like peptidase domain-containing protein [Planctomycetota bacterium]